MGRKKKKQSKPWCWYCNREFDDEKILIQHQKAKHFKCHICHKKLYTGPGLSIHCMQVHKETIDKVPNSLPNRGNIEIEIYGMEGIPDADLKAHENAKNNEDDDEPGAKRAKSDSPALIGQPLPGAGMSGGLAPSQVQMMGVPGMPGLIQPALGVGIPGLGMRQPFLAAPGFPYGVGMMAAQPSAPVQYTGQPTGPGGQPAPQVRPLFPSAQPGTPSPGPPASRATFPAYSAEAEPEKKPQLIASTGSSSKIIHPPEDISLEEMRAAMPKYKPAPAAVSSQAGQQVVASSGLQMVMPATASLMAQQQTMVDAASQLQMLQHQQQQQQQQLLRPGLMPGMIPGLPMQPLGGVPASMALPGLVSQPQLLAARPPMLGLPTQPAMLGMGGQVLVGGLPGMPAVVQQVPHLAPHHLGLIGVPRFR